MKRLLALVALALVGAAACGPPVPTPQPGRNPVIVGDSIIMGAQLQGSLNGMPNAFIDADPGRGIRQPGFVTGRDAWVTIPRVLNQLTPGGWLVLGIGTNDLPIADNAPGGTSLYPGFITDMLSQVPANVCVAFVEVAVWSSQQRITQSQAWNAALRNAANGRSCARVVPWFEQTRNRTFQILQSDLTHPNAQGNNELGLLITAATR